MIRQSRHASHIKTLGSQYLESRGNTLHNFFIFSKSFPEELQAHSQHANSLLTARGSWLVNNCAFRFNEDDVLNCHHFSFTRSVTINALPSRQPFSKGCKEQRPDSDRQTAIFQSADFGFASVITIKGNNRITASPRSSFFSFKISSVTKIFTARSRTLHLKKNKSRWKPIAQSYQQHSLGLVSIFHGNFLNPNSSENKWGIHGKE